MKKMIIVLAVAAFAIKSYGQASQPQTQTAPPANNATQTQAQPAAQPQVVTPDPNAGDFSFTEESYDFGHVPKGTPVTHEFTFANTGKEPIVINNVQASCGCTTPKWPKDPILPGKASTIQVQYNAAHPGGFNKSVTITSNAKSNPKVLYIKGVVDDQTDQTTPDKQPSMLSAPNNN